MIVSTPFRRLAGVALGFAMLSAPAMVLAETTTHPPVSSVPSANELARISSSGSYLAARHARGELATPHFALVDHVVMRLMARETERFVIRLAHFEALHDQLPRMDHAMCE